MSDQPITYSMIRAVRDETGASHEECRRVLERSGGDVAGAAALWFAGKRGDGAAGGQSGAQPLDPTEPQSQRR